jgi:hypothetical protein
VYVSPGVTLITISAYAPVPPKTAPPQQHAGLEPPPAPHAWNLAIDAPTGTVHVHVPPSPYCQFVPQTFILFVALSGEPDPGGIPTPYQYCLIFVLEPSTYVGLAAKYAKYKSFSTSVVPMS